MQAGIFRLAASVIFVGYLGTCLRAQEMAPLLSPDHPILVAAKQGNLDEVVGLLKGEVTVNSCTDEGLTAFRVALQYGHLGLARELTVRGFNPMLFYRSPRVGYPIRIGLTPLVLAAKNGADDIVDYLIDHGMTAYPERVEDKFAGDTDESPVLAAIESDRSKIVRRLLISAPRLIVESEIERNGYGYLAACQSIVMINALAEFGVDVNDTEPKGPFPRPGVLHAYAKRGWRDGIDRLLLLGADPTKADWEGKLPQDVANDAATKHKLQLAVAVVHVEHGLSNYGSDGPAKEFPADCLGTAFNESEDAAIARVQTASDANLRATDDRGWTILTYALDFRLVRLARALIDRGANVSQVTTPGSAMISFAATTGDLDLVKLMKAKGADVDLARRGKPTALILAVRGRNEPMVDLLLSLGAKVDPPHPPERDAVWQSALMIACRNGDLPMMKKLLKAGADLTAVDSSGEGIVSYAVRSGDLAVLDWTLQRGASPFVKTPQGDNALTVAASLGDLPMVQALLKLGVTHPDVLRYAQRGSPSTEGTDKTFMVQKYLQALRRSENPFAPEIFWLQPKITVDDVRRYINAGGDINYADGVVTPLQQRATHGDVDSVSLLLEKGADPRKRARVMFPAATLAIESNNDDTALALVRLFLAHGVSPDTRFHLQWDDQDGEPTGDTLLGSAVGRGLLKTADCLLSAGANPWLRCAFSGNDSFDQLDLVQSIDIDQLDKFRRRMEEFGKKFPRPEILKDAPKSRPKGEVF